MTVIPVTARTLRIREAYKKLPVAMETNPYRDGGHRMFCTGDRWVTLPFLEAWQKYRSTATTRLRRSLAEADELRASEPIILDDELLAGHLWLPDHTEEEQKRYETLCDAMEMSSFPLHVAGARKDHVGLDFEKLIRVGIEGLLAEIADAEKKDTDPVYPDFEALKKKEFYQCCRVELEAVLDLAARYAERAEQMAAEAASPRKEELQRMADALRQVPAKPARSFFEAMQSVQFYLSTLFGLYPLCRPDRYLYPLYRRDLDAGVITREEAQELVDNFCLYVSDRVFSRAACGFIVGGQNADSSVVENDLTWMFITALDHIRMSDPNGALAVNRNTSGELLSYAAEILGKGVTHPAFYNDEVITESLVRCGCTREEAVEYIHSTCAEMTVSGKSRGHTTCATVDLPDVLNKTLRETAEKHPKTAELSFDDFLERYLAAVKRTLCQSMERYLFTLLEAGRNGNESMRASCLVDDCIARGRSISEGGERYCFIQPIFIGFATTVDALEALRTLVYEEGKLTYADCAEILSADFGGQENLRQYILNKIPHYGNDDPRVDSLAAALAAKIASMVKEDDVPGHANMMPGTFSYINHATHGKWQGATLDGRLAGFSYSDGCSPVQGMDTHGPTAMICSLTGWDQRDFLAGMVVNVRFSKSNFTEEKRKMLVGMVRAFMERGGLEIQINSVDTETLKDAKLHPEAHSELLVRIGGYSEYFTRLTPELQDEVIKRTEY